MGKILKLGFAMGGGVSLGTFSGAALTEVIKQAIAIGTDHRGQRFDKVEVDVFAGASAGSMSLGIMLRGLTDISITDGISQNAEQRLKEQFGIHYDALSDELKQDLIVAQKLQDLQEKIWVKDIDIEALIPDNGKHLKYEAGILENKAVADIARKYFKPQPNIQKRRILANRVLFGSTLANLSSIKYDAKEAFKQKEKKGKYDDTLLLALNDGMTSYGHREMRVFDLYYSTIDKAIQKEEPLRWLRAHDGAPFKEDENRNDSAVVDNVSSPECWSKIIATAIASGAFPFAFEPVVLDRKKHEFGKLWPKEFGDKTAHFFSYVDGGTFNNEPIREAFRLAHFIDAQDSRNPNEYERRIVFVDPNISEEKVDFTVKVHNQYRNTENETEKLLSRAKLGNLVGSLASGFVNEARSVHADKVLGVRSRFGFRRDLISSLNHLKGKSISTETLNTAFHGYLSDYIGYDRVNSLLPESKKNPVAILKKLIETDSFFDGLTDTMSAADFADKIKNNENVIENSGWWYSAIMRLYLDLGMDLNDKSESAYLLPIAPIEFSVNSSIEKPDGEIRLLPGGGLQGFAGFASTSAGEYEVEIAKYCANQFMRHLKLIPFDLGLETMTPLPDLLTYEDLRKSKEFRRRIRLLYKRLKHIVTGGNPLGNIGIGIVNLFYSIPKALEEVKDVKRFELRIEVPDDRFELDSVKLLDIGDIRPLKLNGKYYLIGFAEFDFDSNVWSGDQVEDNKLEIDRDRKIGIDYRYACINMPKRAQVDKILLQPYPIFRYSIDESSKGDFNLPADKWICDNPGVIPLEYSIFK